MSTLTAFILGLVVGWVVEWVIDWLYWRRQRASLVRDLDQANAESRRLRADNNDLESHYATQRQELIRSQEEVASLKAEKEALQAQAAKLTPVEATRTETIDVTPQPAAAAVSFERDDLEAIVGIGPVIARKLNEAGIYTFSDLGRLTADDLREKVGAMISRLANEDDILRQARQLDDQKNHQE